MTGRRPRLSRDELYGMFIEAGRSILREEGLGAGAERLTFRRVSERVERDTGIRVTNASLIGRVWENQFDYQTDVLATIAATVGPSIDETVGAVTPVLLEMNPTSEESRRATLREICRLSAAANTEALSRSTDLSLWIGIWSVTAVGSVPDRRRRIETALQQSYEEVTERMEMIYQAGLDFVGYRVRPGLTVRQFTIATAALSDGCVLRDRVDADHMHGIVRPTGPDGEDQEWTLFGLAVEALADAFFELDPDWVPPRTDAVPVTVEADGSDRPAGRT